MFKSCSNKGSNDYTTNYLCISLNQGRLTNMNGLLLSISYQMCKAIIVQYMFRKGSQEYSRLVGLLVFREVFKSCIIIALVEQNSRTYLNSLLSDGALRVLCGVLSYLIVQ